ncbi:unknown protein [Simkania negevensis Z]|uniref:Uncharacterized protein n=1 Tax=Simkania negevensis (strain ATCC VR-1471 / DSM 27360 / Z) TaxID=331113 RepID=F8L5C5_SIMNZ|nr:unknown protein [Simkania negevensis Z]
MALSIGKNTENLRELSLLRLSKINPEFRLIEHTQDGKIMRQPRSEFNSIFCTPTVIVRLGTVKEDVGSQLKLEEAASEALMVQAVVNLLSPGSKFRN